MALFFTSDWHLGDDRFEIMNRPFVTTEEMNTIMINNHNSVVAPDDHVIVIGDVCYQKHSEYLNHVEKFNGKKTLIRGNHDRVFSDNELSQYFDVIIPEGEGLLVDCEGITCYATHYPNQAKITHFNLCGHIHGAWRCQLNMLNVGVDVHHFRPVNSKSILKHFTAICQYYDNDVWIAYNEINSTYLKKRGRHGNYFNSI